MLFFKASRLRVLQPEKIAGIFRCLSNCFNYTNMIGSITSHCSEKEIWLLPEKTAGHVGMLLSLFTNQIVACPNQAGSLNTLMMTLITWHFPFLASRNDTWEAIYGWSRANVEVKPRSTFRFMRALSYKASILPFTHVNFTRVCAL